MVPKEMRTREVIRRLTRAGFVFSREGGRHDIYRCGCGEGHQVPVPRHQMVSAGVVGALARQCPCLDRNWWR
jgi:predicted RNA binding protein YcfA (HicA-like mRNA interferase family)